MKRSKLRNKFLKARTFWIGKIIHLKEIFVKNCEKTPKELISIISTLRKLIITKHFGKLSLHPFLINLTGGG